MLTRFRSGAVEGIDGYVVTVEVDLGRGLPAFHIVGLPNPAVRESRERVLAAIRNSGFPFPLGRVTVNLAPADIRKEGASFDLAIALGVIAAQSGDRSRPRDRIAGERTGDRAMSSEALLLGELSLFGELRPVRGLLAIAQAAASRGVRTLVVPRSQVWEARLVPELEIHGARDLAQVVGWWRHGTPLASGPARSPRFSGPRAQELLGRRQEEARLSFAGLRGQQAAQRAAVLAAAGRHHLLLVGPPGTGKTRLARALAGLLPPLGDEEVVAVTRIHSAAGTLRGTAPSRLPPFRSPHHTVTRAGLVGGGGNLRPGEVTLAHQGLLFLDELGEFSPAVLDVLREPLEEGRLAMVRGNGRHVYPADFQLLAAMNPCRCGFLGSRRRPCRCSPAALALYRGRLSGPLLDRIDLFVEMVESPPVLLQDGRAPSAGEGEGWPALLRRIRQARDLLRDRPDSMLDSDPETLARAWGLDGTALRCLEEARVGLGLSIRGVLRCARVARTAAALDGRAQVARADVLEALTFRLETLPGFAAEPSGHVP